MDWSSQISQPIERYRAPVENTVVSACPVPSPAVRPVLVTLQARTLMARPVRMVIATAPRGPPHLFVSQVQQPLPPKVAVFSWAAA